METTTTEVAGRRLDRSTLPLLITLGIGVFAGAFDLGVLSPALPAIGDDFRAKSGDLSLVYTVYLLADVISIPIASKLSDLYGRRVVYVRCLELFAAGSVIAVLSPNYLVFLIGRAVQAAGAGGIFPVATATIADVVPQERRGAALGILGGLWGFAGIVGPISGGVLTTLFGWPAVFIANVPLALLVVALATRYVPSNPLKRHGPLDVFGIIALGLTLGGIIVALTHIDPQGSHGANRYLAISGLSSAAIGITLLASAERTADEPMIPPLLFRSRQIIVTYALELLIGLLEGSLFFIPAALVRVNGITPAFAGMVAAIGAFVFVIVIPLAGRALDRYGSRSVLSYGTSITALGLALFAFSLSNIWLAMVAIALAGVGFGSLLGAPTRYIVSNEAAPQMRATAIGLLSVFLLIGQIVGGSLAGGIVALGGAEGFRYAYLSFAVVAVCALGVTFLLKSRTAERVSSAVVSS